MEIPLTQGKLALIDDADYDLVKRLRWCACWEPRGKVFYVRSSEGIYLHRLIMQPDPAMTVDHINHNPLDNRRSNLRIATRSQNQMNRGKQSNNTTGYKGVSLFKRTGKYRAYIMVQGKETHLGYFTTAEEASAAYQAKLGEFHGEFARFN